MGPPLGASLPAIEVDVAEIDLNHELAGQDPAVGVGPSFAQRKDRAARTGVLGVSAIRAHHRWSCRHGYLWESTSGAFPAFFVNFLSRHVIPMSSMTPER
jgi:hypothetical protein